MSVGTSCWIVTKSDEKKNAEKWDKIAIKRFS
jgi:hypothetical protein